jgi:hypothetical protein
MNTKRKFFIVTNGNPNNGPTVAEYEGMDALREAIATSKLDLATVAVFQGSVLPVRQEMSIVIGEPKRRGRPPGAAPAKPRAKKTK